MHPYLHVCIHYDIRRIVSEDTPVSPPFPSAPFAVIMHTTVPPVSPDLVKRRADRITTADRNKVCYLHDGKGWRKFQMINPMAVGLKWGDFVKVRQLVSTRKAKNKAAKAAKASKPKK